MIAFPTEQPLPSVVATLPVGPGIVDYAISVPLVTNRTAGGAHGGAGVPRVLFTDSHRSVQASSGASTAAQVATSVRMRIEQQAAAAAVALQAGSSGFVFDPASGDTAAFAASSSAAEIAPVLRPDIVVTLIDANGVRSNVTLPPLLQPVTVTSAAVCTQTAAGDTSGCTVERMRQICAAQSGCSNAIYVGAPCPNNRPCVGCSYVVYQSTMCLVLAHSNKTGFSLARGAPGANSFLPQSCLYPFAPENQPVACSAQESERGVVHLMFFHEADPFLVAQNATRGTMLFAGYTQASQREIGLGLACGGAALIVVCALAWVAMRIAMRDDNPTKRHFYGAFWQEYIPSPRAMAESVRAGTSGKYDGGFKPKVMMNARPSAVAAATSAGGGSAVLLPRTVAKPNKEVASVASSGSTGSDGGGHAHHLRPLEEQLVSMSSINSRSGVASSADPVASRTAAAREAEKKAWMESF